MRALSAITILFALVLLCACATAAPTPLPTPAPTPNPLSGGVLAEFELNGQTFHVWVTNPDTIQQLMELEAGTSDANIPNGKILRGPGVGDHNAPWGWHLDPQEIEMAEFTTEVCDAEPQYVEDNLADFVDVVGRYCPWSANLISLQDFR